MTLAEELEVIADRLRYLLASGYGYDEDDSAPYMQWAAAQLEGLAQRCAGRVLVTPEIQLWGEVGFVAVIDAGKNYGRGATAADAVMALQEALEAQSRIPPDEGAGESRTS